MNNEHTFALVRETTGTNTATGPASDQSVNDAAERIRVALAELNQVRIGPMSRPKRTARWDCWVRLNRWSPL